jgi:hypothetical protein
VPYALSTSLSASAPCVTAAPARSAAAMNEASVTFSRVAPAFLEIATRLKASQVAKYGRISVSDR